VLSFLGHPVFWLLIATVLYWSHREKNAFFLVNLILFASAVTAVLKVFLARPRPLPTEFRVFPENPLLKQFEQGIDFSFPSGHSLTISAVVAYYSKKYKKTVLLLLGVLAVILVGLSRMVLGLHFFSDVIAGIVLGLVIGKAVWKLQQSFEKHSFRLTKLEAETGLLAIVLVSLFITVVWDKPALVAGLLGFYAGFFLVQEKGFKQTPVHHSLQTIKIVVGLLVLALILLPAIFWTNGFLQFAFLFAAGFWVSFLYPWLFEKAVRSPIKIDVSYRRPRK
jgi:membrane-associated phospholipid phosphatase